jgi:hypothetical protein
MVSPAIATTFDDRLRKYLLAVSSGEVSAATGASQRVVQAWALRLVWPGNPNGRTPTGLYRRALEAAVVAWERERLMAAKRSREKPPEPPRPWAQPARRRPRRRA